MPWNTDFFEKSHQQRRHFEACLAFVILIIVMACVLTIYRQETGATNKVACAQRLKRMMVAFEMYAQDHDGLYPPQENWSHAILPYVDTLEVYFCPSDSDLPRTVGKKRRSLDAKNPASYWYVQSPQNSEDSTSVYVVGDRMFENMVGNHDDGGNVAFLDSHVKWYSLDQWQKHKFPTQPITSKKHK